MNPGICRWRVEKCLPAEGWRHHRERHSVVRFRDLALDDRLSVDAAAITLLLTQLVSSAALDALFNREHLPQCVEVQDEQPCKDPELHLTDLHICDFFVKAISPT